MVGGLAHPVHPWIPPPPPVLLPTLRTSWTSTPIYSVRIFDSDFRCDYRKAVKDDGGDDGESRNSRYCTIGFLKDIVGEGGGGGSR